MNVCSARIVNGDTYNPINTLLLPAVLPRCITRVISYEYARRLSETAHELPDDVVDPLFMPGERNCVILFENRLYDHRFHYKDFNYKHFRVQFFKKLRERLDGVDISLDNCIILLE